MAKSDFSKMCEPAKLYLLVSVVALVYGIFQRFSMITLGTNFIFAVLWTMVLNWLCSIGMKTISWILVLLPYLMLFLSAGFVMDMMHSKEGFYKETPEYYSGIYNTSFKLNKEQPEYYSGIYNTSFKLQ